MFVDSLPGCRVSIGDPETRARYDEYALPDDDDTSTTHQHDVKYVAAVAGKIFSIHLDIDPEFPFVGGDLQVTVRVDGSVIQRAIPRIHHNREHVKVDGASSYENGVHTIQRYTFGQLKTTEGPAKQKDFDQVKSLGDIKIDIVRCKRGHVQHASHLASIGPSSSTVVPEKALKGRSITASVSMIRSQPRADVPKVCSPTFPWGQVSIASYTFRYRSRCDLQAEMIIPRSPSPVPLEERNPEDLTLEEARELIARQRVRLDQQSIKKEEPRVKRELSYGEDSDIEEVPAPKKSRASADSAVEVIDLSGD